MPNGRKSSYSVALADEILDLISSGNSLASICADEAMPDYRTVRRWLATNEAFRLNYARAREVQAEYYADRIADRASQEPAIVEGHVDAGEVAHRRLEIDSLKWIASKLLPKKYGEKIGVEHSGGTNDTLNILTEERRLQLVERRKAALTGGN